MLTSVQSLQKPFRKGVVENSVGGKVIVPLNYTEIVYQKYGISAINEDGTEDGYLYTGTPVIQSGKKILFLKNHLMVITNPKNNRCYIFNHETGTLACEYEFESILFFYGSETQAIPYNSKTDLRKMFLKSDYSKNGAYLENLVCAKFSGKWGVYNLEKHCIHSHFIHKTIVQCKNGQIAVRGNDSSVQML